MTKRGPACSNETHGETAADQLMLSDGRVRCSWWSKVVSAWVTTAAGPIAAFCVDVGGMCLFDAATYFKHDCVPMRAPSPHLWLCNSNVIPRRLLYLSRSLLCDCNCNNNCSEWAK
jgi:hypothetical protein